jgi:hypothetical protein
MDSAVAKTLAKPASKGAFAALNRLNETTTDVMTRMDLYTMYLPRLTRWEAELIVDDLTRGVDPRKMSSEFARLTEATSHIASITEMAPEEMKKERIAILEGIKDIVDHVFFRTVQLLLLCAALFAFGIVIRSYVRRHP